MATLFSPSGQQRLFRDGGQGMPRVHPPLAATPSRLPVIGCRRRAPPPRDQQRNGDQHTGLPGRSEQFSRFLSLL